MSDRPDGPPATGEDGGGSDHRVTLSWDEGRTTAVAVPADRTVLEAAEDAGVGIPFGCRTGACGTCTGQVIDADGDPVPGAADGGSGAGNDGGRETGDGAVVDHRRPPRALKDRHLADGYVLTCVARPREGCRIRVGKDVAAELVDNPWK